MDWLSDLGLSPQLQTLATIAFVIALAVFAAYSRTIGKKEGPPQPKVQEFYASGQFADMGPVRELLEQAGLLFQQQVRTNMLMEASAKAQQQSADALTKFSNAYEHRIESEEREKEIADEVDRRLREIKK
jgi:hypothetical protein